MAIDVTKLCNMALSRIGSKRINNFDTDTSVEAQQCQTHYEPARDALLRSCPWRFALKRVALSADTTSPAFGFDYQFILPADFLAMGTLYDSTETYALEGERLLTDESSCQIVYVRRIADPTKFDAMFVELLALTLAVRLVMPLSQDKKAKEQLDMEVLRAMSKARLKNLQEINTIGRSDLHTWLDSRVDGVPLVD